jgi:hypothetical protein
MKFTVQLCRFAGVGALVAASLTLSYVARAAGPEIVSGPSADPPILGASR